MHEDVPVGMTVEGLRSVPLFASLDDKTARGLLDLLGRREAAAGSVLFRAGDAGDALYLIESGRVRISIHDADGHELTLAELKRGDFFGEMALLDGHARSADANVVEAAQFAVLAREDFLEFVRAHTDVALRMLAAIANRLRQTDQLLRHRVSRNVNEEMQARLTIADRMADLLARFGGSWTFIGVALSIISLWVLLNTLLLRDTGFDPYPYIFLSFILNVITGLQAPIIMMSQNREAGKDRLRADLDYQVNLKNELALTEVLRRLDVLESERLPMLFREQKAESGRQ